MAPASQFGQCEPKEFARGIERKSKEVIKLPKPLFEALSNVAQRPDSFKVHRSRKAEHAAVLGGYCSGYRMDPLFDLPETRALTQAVGERCAKRLDSGLSNQKTTLYEDQLAELGVLLELTNVGLFRDTARVERWKQGFSAMNARTTEERPFWDEYAACVDELFVMLTAP